MPERPDLEHIAPILAERLVGSSIAAVRVKKPVVLRAPVGIDVLVGTTFRRVERRGHFVVLGLAPPKATTASLSPDQLDRLHAAMRKVLGEARDILHARNPPIDEKLRDFLKVRNRAGEPCPRCGGKIRAAGVRGHDAFFCPTCQPDTAGKGFAGWR